MRAWFAWGSWPTSLDQIFFVSLAMTLYMLLKHVNKGVARVMVILVALAACISCLNVVFEFEGLRVATGAVNFSSLGTSGSHAVVLLLLDAQHYGLLVAQIFFGLWLAPLGYLAYKSGWFPKPLGVALIAATAAYIIDLLAAFLLPGGSGPIHGVTSIVPAIAETSMVIYLLAVGVKSPKPAPRVLAAALAS